MSATQWWRGRLSIFEITHRSSFHFFIILKLQDNLGSYQYCFCNFTYLSCSFSDCAHLRSESGPWWHIWPDHRLCLLCKLLRDFWWYALHCYYARIFFSCPVSGDEKWSHQLVLFSIISTVIHGASYNYHLPGSFCTLEKLYSLTLVHHSQDYAFSVQRFLQCYLCSWLFI